MLSINVTVQGVAVTLFSAALRGCDQFSVFIGLPKAHRPRLTSINTCGDPKLNFDFTYRRDRSCQIYTFTISRDYLLDVRINYWVLLIGGAGQSNIAGTVKLETKLVIYVNLFELT